MNLFDQFDAVLGEQAATINLGNAKPGEPIKTQQDREAEWLQQRWGVFTASEIYKLMTYPDKDDLPKGAISYVLKKAAESLTEFSVQPFISDAMQWGLIHEPEAIDAFQACTGLEVIHCKEGQQFIDRGHVGGTPDGIIPIEFSGLEIKCPNSDTHIGYLQIKTGQHLKTEAPAYYWQVQCLMMLTQSQHWYFVSYDPRFKQERLRLHIAKIYANPADRAKLQHRLALADRLKTNIITQLEPA